VRIAETSRVGWTFYRLAAGPAPNHTAARLGANVAVVRGPLGNLLHHRMHGTGGRITLSPCCMDVSAWTLSKRREEGMLCIALEPFDSAASMLPAACVERGTTDWTSLPG